MPDLDTPDLDTLPAAAEGWRFDNSYARLPDAFFEAVEPTRVTAPAVVIFNRELAERLGLDGEALGRPEAADLFVGNRLPDGAQPIAQAYAGHQFGYPNMLGDGRAILLGEQWTPDGCRFDIQLKGSGRTRFSRGGDGRAALGPMLREHVIGEAMHELGIPTTRSLAVATTGEAVRRETALPGAILTRVASSHLRVGTFEYAAARQDPALLRALADYTIERHAPEGVDAETRYLALLDSVIEGQAALIARWMLVGFVHGVMNTDNAALSGETIDYGPCAFLDAYDPDTVFSSIDHHGRYAYGQQPVIGQWNMARFAETLLSLIDPTPEVAVEHAQASIERFVDRYEHHWLAGMKAKLGWVTDEPDDAERIAHFLGILHEQRGDFTNTFRALTAGSLDEQPAFGEWLADWRQRIARQPLDPTEVTALQERHNPAVIPRNHRVEAALDAAWQDGDLGPFERLVEALREPYDHRRERADGQEPAPDGSPPYRTFCGT